ncbi:hypothetical protein ElyMa_000855100 [Elysia marginata]|uniref:Uncharacterized protein n=1 Tax=Elysia marginata TaxID=1093978 RepID=A0AAV4H2Y7_9GAST|nr:hypothetical protein ElyMa_000855100 [Elysia marginata]
MRCLLDDQDERNALQFTRYSKKRDLVEAKAPNRNIQTESDPPLTLTDHPATSDVRQGGESYIPADTVDTADLASAVVPKQSEVRSQSETQMEADAKKFCEKQKVVGKTANNSNKPRDSQNKPREKGTRHRPSSSLSNEQTYRGRKSAWGDTAPSYDRSASCGSLDSFFERGKRKQEDTIERSPFKRPSIPYS